MEKNSEQKLISEFCDMVYSTEPEVQGYNFISTYKWSNTVNYIPDQHIKKNIQSSEEEVGSSKLEVGSSEAEVQSSKIINNYVEGERYFYSEGYGWMIDVD